MISSVCLERPGRWRAVGVAALLLLALLPAVPLFWRTLSSGEPASLGGAYGGALWNSVVVAALVGVTTLAVGLPAGLLASLYDFPGRRILLVLLVLPVLVPSFLWAIGWSSLAARLGPAATAVLSGHTGCVVVFFAEMFPLVLLTSYAATIALSGSQIDAARLAGGEKAVLRHACRYVAVPAGLAAGLGGVLTLSDPGPGQILGLQTAASEILTSFSALYDFNLAGRQCLGLAALVLLSAMPLVYLAAPRLAAEIMGRQSRTFRRLGNQRIALVAGVGFTLLVLCMVIVPLTGLVVPLLDGFEFRRTWSEVSRTGLNTLFYAGGAGTVAALMGLLVAFFVGRSQGLRTVCLGVCLALFCLPPALGAFGIIDLATRSPAWADPFLRSQTTVGLALGLRFFPVAALLGLRAWGTMSVSWAQAAGIHAVPLGTYARKVVIPFLLPTGGLALLLVALLATADVGTVLLLHPPGKSSLPLAIFTVMANAPESLVASLCLAYVGSAAGLLLITSWTIVRKRAG